MHDGLSMLNLVLAVLGDLIRGYARAFNSKKSLGASIRCLIKAMVKSMWAGKLVTTSEASRRPWTRKSQADNCA